MVSAECCLLDPAKRTRKHREVLMTISAPAMPTIGEIARRLGQPIHRIEYVVRVRGIRPTGWAGNARVFADGAIEVIAAELQRISEAKSHDHAGCG